MASDGDLIIRLDGIDPSYTLNKMIIASQIDSGDKVYFDKANTSLTSKSAEFAEIIDNKLNLISSSLQKSKNLPIFFYLTEGGSKYEAYTIRVEESFCILMNVEIIDHALKRLHEFCSFEAIYIDSFGYIDLSNIAVIICLLAYMHETGHIIRGHFSSKANILSKRVLNTMQI